MCCGVIERIGNVDHFDPLLTPFVGSPLTPDSVHPDVH